MRHTGWCRIRVTPQSDPAAAAALEPFARNLLGNMLNGLSVTGQRTGIMRRQVPGGATVTVMFDGTTPIIDIDAPPSTETLPEDVPTNLWVPRGFVIYPAWQDAQGGVGLPVVQSGDDPYAKANLSPGLDRARWTAGGPCGEVLLSPDKDAGYPTNSIVVTAPLLFHPTKGPHLTWNGKTMYDTRPIDGTWAAYRIEFEIPQRHHSDDDPATALALFEQLNQVREGSGVHSLILTPRGYAKKAEISSSIMLASGSTEDFNAAYPATYQHAYDRLTKDGVTCNLIANTFPSWDRGTFLSQYELRSNAGSASDAIAEWNADPSLSPILTANLGVGGFSSTGARGGYLCATVESYTGWLGAGNAHWQSSDTDLPVISWYSFASMNLSFDTFPCVFDAPHHDTAPLVPVFNFTTPTGDCWMNYIRNGMPTAADVEPAMSRHIFCRGRRIAVAPNGGLVWGACVQSVTLDADAGTVDRLIALVHHPEDQPGSLIDGMTRYLRVWWCDIPKRTNLRLDPQNIICGTDSSDTWSWKGGDQIDLGNMPAPATGPQATGSPNSLKYSSVWRFAPDGTKAACLRDYGAAKDYGGFYADNFVSNGVALLNSRTVELAFSCAANSVTTTPTFHDYIAGQTAPLKPIDAPLDVPGTIVQPFQLYLNGCAPTAVDYDDNGSLIYALTGRIDSQQQVAFEYKGRGQAYTYDFVYFGTGTAATKYADQFANRTLVGSAFTSAGIDYTIEGAAIADIATGAIAVLVSHPWHTDGVWEDPDPPCRSFTTNPTYGVKLYQRGTKLAEQWFDNPDGFVAGITTFCWTAADYRSSAVSLNNAVSQAIQVYYGERFGQSIFCTQFSPVPSAALYLDDVPSGDDCGCGLTLTDFFTHTHRMAFSEWSPRGGLTQATVPIPNNDWLIYAKVV